MENAATLASFQLLSKRSDHPAGGRSYNALDELGRNVRLWVLTGSEAPQIAPPHPMLLETYETLKSGDDYLMATRIPPGRNLKNLLTQMQAGDWRGHDFVGWLAGTKTQTDFDAEGWKRRNAVKTYDGLCTVVHLIEQLLQLDAHFEKIDLDYPWSADHIWINEFCDICVDPPTAPHSARPSTRTPDNPRLASLIREMLRSVPGASPLVGYGSDRSLMASIASLGIRTMRQRGIPPKSKITELIRLNPFAAIATTLILTNGAASFVQIRYNAAFIVDRLSAEQISLFKMMVLPWNILVFGVATSIFVLRFRSTLRCLGQKNQRDSDMAKQTCLIPAFAGKLIIVGWSLGCVLFTTTLHFYTGPLPAHALWHFVASFAIATLIAWSYTVSGLLHMCTRVLVWTPSPKGSHPDVAKHLLRIHTWSNFLTPAVPLFGACLVVLAGPEFLDTSHLDAFRGLVAVFVVTGLFGLFFSLGIGRKTHRSINVLVTPLPEKSPA